METTLAILITLQGSNSFSVRQAATESLRELGPAAYPHLVAYGRTHEDTEIRWRSETICKQLEAELIDGMLARLAMTPWIDSLPPEWPGREWIVRSFLAGIPAGAKQEGNRWPRYSQATRNYLHTLDYDLARQLVNLMQPMTYYSPSDREWYSWDMENQRRVRIPPPNRIER